MPCEDIFKKMRKIHSHVTTTASYGNEWHYSYCSKGYYCDLFHSWFNYNWL